MVLESSSDDFKAGWCKVGFKTLLRPQDSHGLDNTNTYLIVDENIFWFRISRRLIPTLILAQHAPLKTTFSRIFASSMEENHEQCRTKYCPDQCFSIHGK